MYRAIWAREKRALAARLAAGGTGGTYAEAAIVLCAVISALSSDVWPEPTRDRLKFVEALKRFVRSELVVDHVSVPLLAARLQKLGRLADAQTLKDRFVQLGPSRILASGDVDCDEATVLAVCPNLRLPLIRSFSYANLLYREVRCSYAHAYRPGDSADSVPMTSDTRQPVSYINRIDTLGGVTKLIHFHWQWLGEVAVSLAEGIDLEATCRQEPPDIWWLDGKVRSDFASAGSRPLLEIE